MGKIGIIFVILAPLGTARCSNADLAKSLMGVPIVGPLVEPPVTAPAYVNAIGTPAAFARPEAGFAMWFPVDPGPGYSGYTPRKQRPTAALRFTSRHLNDARV